MGKIRNLLKQKKFIYGGLAVLLILGVAFFVLRDPQSKEETISISRGEFINQVYVSGKVVASEEVELGFNKGGRITRVFYDVDGSGIQGPLVKAGASIAKIDAKEVEKEVSDASLDLESARLALAKFKLENSEDNLSADLDRAYEDGFTNIADAFLDLSSIITGLDNILNDFPDSTVRLSGNTATRYKDEAEKAYYVAYAAFKELRISFRAVDRESSRKEIESILDETYETSKLFSEAIKKLKNLADYMADDREDEATYVEAKETLAEYTATISGHLSTILSSQNEISDYQEVFPTTNLDIKDLELDIRQKESALRDARNNLLDYFIRAPFNGVITKIDAKVGEIASPDMPLVTMMSSGKFQIESFVPEVNIALIKLGDTAKVTLDAYGESVEFDAKIASIDPAETIRDGVSTYKIRLQFDMEDDRIKSGMTANVSIIIFEKPDVIVVPGGVVFQKDGKDFVLVKTDQTVSPREVVLGDKSALGQVEIISGLSEGEMVILNPNTD